MAVTQTKALILRHSPDRENDRLLTVLTPTLGKLDVRARGTKKSVSKLGGSLEPLLEVDLSLANGRRIDVVTGSVILQRWPQLRQHLVSMVAAQWLLELVNRVTKPNQPEQGLYPMVITMLSAMETEVGETSGRQWLRLYRRAWQILHQEGFLAGVDECAVCHQPLPAADVAFHPQAGFIHVKEAPTGAVRLAEATVQFLIHEQEPANQRQAFRELRQVITSAIEHTLDRPLRSETVLQKIMRLEQLSA